jgi:hypothetical protein
MQDNPASNIEIYKLVVDVLKLAGLAVAGTWAYYRFFRQRTFAPNLLTRWECIVHGKQSGYFITEFRILIENIGSVIVRLPMITADIRGLKRDSELPKPNDNFSLQLPDVLYVSKNIVSEKVDYEYVEPRSKLIRKLFVHAHSRLSINEFDTFVASEIFDLDNPAKNKMGDETTRSDKEQPASDQISELLQKLAGSKRPD